MVKLLVFLWLALPAFFLGAPAPERWIPARWDGGPLELARRAHKPGPPTEKRQEALSAWYSPATLDLLEGTPINCLLVTFSADADPEIENRQHALVRDYAAAARSRGIAVLGIVHPGRDPVSVAAASGEARLDGLVLEAGFPDAASFAGELRAALRVRNDAAIVVTIEKEAAPLRRANSPLQVLAGVRPSARDLADMGVRAGPSAEPWIESNIWLVHSLRRAGGLRPVWIHQEADAGAPGEYLRCVADAALAGGRWIISLDDDLRAGLFQKNPEAIASWRSINAYLQFAEAHPEWGRFEPYGKVAILLDPASPHPDFADEYLNLVARRHIPYRILLRSEVSAASLAPFTTVLAADIATPTDPERTVLRAFAEAGGVLIAGPSWGNPPSDSEYAGAALGKGRVIVYKDAPPDPETVARDMLDLLEPDQTGLSLFNVPSVLTFVSESGSRRLVQLLNYATTPFNSKITVRVKGTFKTARLYTPEAGPADLSVRARAEDWTEFAVPKLAVWGAVLLE
jgi:hypothetical protein